MIEQVTHAELVASGYLVAPDVRELQTSYEFAYSGPDDWAALIAAIWRDEARNRLIVDATAAEARAGRSVLLLTGRVEHAEMLTAHLNAQGVSAAALTGQTPKSERASIIARAASGQISVLVATSLADEGLDIPRLSCVVLAYPAKAAGRTQQCIGRVMRPHPGKPQALIIDVVDARVSVLAKHARRRAETFRQVLGDGLQAA